MAIRRRSGNTAAARFATTALPHDKRRPSAAPGADVRTARAVALQPFPQPLKDSGYFTEF
jgi:hypothetical protein